jgi:hypothetical protein
MCQVGQFHLRRTGWRRLGLKSWFPQSEQRLVPWCSLWCQTLQRRRAPLQRRARRRATPVCTAVASTTSTYVRRQQFSLAQSFCKRFEELCRAVSWQQLCTSHGYTCLHTQFLWAASSLRHSGSMTVGHHATFKEAMNYEGGAAKSDVSLTVC